MKKHAKEKNASKKIAYRSYLDALANKHSSAAMRSIEFNPYFHGTSGIGLPPSRAWVSLKGQPPIKTNRTTHMNTLVRIYDELAQAENARSELLRAGFDASSMHLSVRNDESGPVEGNFYVGDPVNSEKAVSTGHGLGGFLKSLIDSDKDDYNGTFRNVVERATYMLTVETAGEEETAIACEITARHGALHTDSGTRGQEKENRP